MIKGFTTRLERRNLYTTIHRGYSCRYGWFNAKTHEMEWPKDPDRMILIPERTQTQDNSLERLTRDYGAVVGFDVYVAYKRGRLPNPEAGLFKRNRDMDLTMLMMRSQGVTVRAAPTIIFTHFV